ncbi:MAG: helicase-associated domain-containing protein [Thermaerobacter sp.]|nr:helicase-associated domain-containing protein [Thermaerobacter sp.]
MPESEPHPYSLQGQLRGMPALVLAQFAGQIGLKITGRENPKELRIAIKQFMQNPETIVERVQQMPEPHRLVLCAIATAGDGRTGSFPLQTGAKADKGEPLLRICRELAERGWLFPDPGYSYGRERGYIVPRDLVGLYGEGAARSLSAKEHPYFFRTDAPGKSAGPELLSALLRVVGAVAREPAKLTQQGSVYRRDIERLRKVRGAVQFSAASPAWGRIEKALGSLAERWSEAPWLDEGRDVGMLLWLALVLGLIEEDAGHLRAVADVSQALRQDGRDGLWEKAVLSLGEFIINAHPAALGTFRLLDKEIWVAPMRWLQDVFSVPLQIPTQDAKYASAACLLALGELGAIEAVMVKDEPLVRLSPVGTAIRHLLPLPEMPLEQEFRVLASGDVLVTPYLAPHVQMELERYARPAKIDVVSTYRIEQGLVVKEVSEGLAPQRVLDFFSGHTADEMPQPVRYRLEEWLQDMGRVEFWEVALIACDTPQMRERVLSTPGVHKDVLDLLGDRWIVIPASAEPRLRAALQEAGIVPLSAVRRPSGLASERALRRSRHAATAYLGRLSVGTQTYARPVGTAAAAED